MASRSSLSLGDQGTTAPRPRVLVVAKRSAYDYYVRKHRMGRVVALLRAGDPSVARLRRADRDHAGTLAAVRATLASLGVRATFRERSRIGSVQGFDVVITVGGDGTLLSTSHSVASAAVFGVNSAPRDSVGYLCSAHSGNVRARLRALVRGELPITTVCRMQVRVDDTIVHARVLNDVLFAHRSPAMTSRYFLAVGPRVEEQKSSGLWIGPATGSTAAIRSAGGRRLAPTSRLIQYLVREPYRPDGTPYALESGTVRPGDTLELWNKMREAALFVDGPRFVVPLEIGQRVRFELSPEPLRIAGLAPGTTHRSGSR